MSLLNIHYSMNCTAVTDSDAAKMSTTRKKQQKENFTEETEKNF